MTQFFKISSYEDDINLLKSKSRLGYSTVELDVRSKLKDYSFQDIFNMNINIYEYENLRIIKLRVKNSGQNLSSRDGFRLIFIADKSTEGITYLHIYPKAGKYGKVSIDENEITSLLEKYIKEKDSLSQIE